MTGGNNLRSKDRTILCFKTCIRSCRKRCRVSTRRQMLGSTASGIGVAALASLLQSDRATRRAANARRPAASCAESQARRRHVARWRPLARRSLRRKAHAVQDGRQRHSRFASAARRGSRRCRAATANGPSSRRSSRTKSTASRALRSANAAQHRRAGRRHVRRPQHEHRSSQSCARCHVLHDRCASSRPAEHGRVALVRAGQRDRQPADVCRDDVERQGQDLRSVVL